MTAEIATDLTVSADMPNDAYHRLPSLSSSGARKLLPPSTPAHFKWQREHPVFKDEYDLGSAAHKLVLGDPLAEIVHVEADAWRTNAAKDAKAKAHGEGKIPLLTKQLEVVKAMAEAILLHPTAAKLFDPDCGKSEQSVFWTEQRSGVELRCRYDWLPDPVAGQRMVIPDYKTTDNGADEATFGRSAANLGYPMQAAWYIDAAKACGLDEDAVFLFVVQEVKPPYLVNVIELPWLDVEVGRQRNRKAIDIYAECVRTDTWPGYGDGIKTARMPGWYGAQYEQEDTQP